LVAKFKRAATDLFQLYPRRALPLPHQENESRRSRERRLRRFAGEEKGAKRRNDYAARLDLIDSADLSDCNTSLNIKAVNDVTASSMSDGARLPGISSVLRCSGTYPPPNIEKTWVLCVLSCIGNLPSSVAAP
jgi:hypothetical protein